MLFKNLIALRLPEGFDLNPFALTDAMEARKLAPVGAFSMQSTGFVPSGPDKEMLVYHVDGACLLTLGIEQKILPSTVIKAETATRAAALAETQGYPVGRRQMRELREKVTEELRAKALSRTTYVNAILDAQAGFLFINAASSSKAELLVEVLRDALGSFGVRYLETQKSPRFAMGAWLQMGDTPDRFTLGTDAELKSVDKSGATVRYKNHPLDDNAVKAHVSGGKIVTRLGLTFADRIDFVMDDKGDIKRIQHLVVAEKDENAEQDADAIFASEFALTVGELRALTLGLIEALGGEMPDEKG